MNQLRVARWDWAEERGRQVGLLLAARRIHKGSGWQYDPFPYVILPPDGIGGRKLR